MRKHTTRTTKTATTTTLLFFQQVLDIKVSRVLAAVETTRSSIPFTMSGVKTPSLQLPAKAKKINK